jgi:hypothetical protein
MPRTPQSAQTLPSGIFRIGIGADAVGLVSPGGGAGSNALVAQGALNARVGLPQGFELDAGAAVPNFQPYGILRYQIKGKGAELGPFITAEGGAAATGSDYTGSDYFAGLALGQNLDKEWEVLVDSRAGANDEDGYVEAGTGIINRPVDWIDVMAGLNFRFYSSSIQPNVARAGLSLEFGNSPHAVELARLARLHAAELVPLYHGDPQKLFDAGELSAAADACRDRLSQNKKDGQTWDLLSKILKAEGDLRGSRKAKHLAIHYGILEEKLQVHPALPELGQ